MASNLSTIGFSFSNAEHRNTTLIGLAKSTQKQIDFGTGAYAVWHSGNGAEIWFYLSEPSANGSIEQNIVGLCPFFEGESTVTLNISEIIKRPGDGPYDGAFYGWVHARGAEKGSYPIVFDAVDFARHGQESWPVLKTARISGFAQTLTAFPDAQSFLAAQSEGTSLAPEAFLPAGLFASALQQSAGEKPAPTSLAHITGRVLRHEILQNELTAQPFHWVLVQSLDATFDIVADPEVVTGQINIGGTVDVACSLFGRVLDDAAIPVAA
jgi:hypothetical protein